MLNECGKKLLKPLVSVQNVVLFCAVVYVVFLLLRSYDLDKSELASWVQAIGSIGAIWGALSIGRKQLESHDSARADELKAKSEAYLAVIESACKNSAKLADLLRGGARLSGLELLWDYHIGELFRVNLNMLKTIPAHELGGYDFVVAHSVVLTKMIRMESCLLYLFETQKQYKKLQPRWVQFQYDAIISDDELVQKGLANYKEAHLEKIANVSSRSSL